MQYTGEVVKGKGRGKTVVQFPTFNLKIPTGFEAREGVYGCHVWLRGKKYRGALHYGPTPTFDETERVLEIFILDYPPREPAEQETEEAMKEPVTKLTFELGPYIRPVATFADPQKLRAQIALDVARVRRSMKLHDEEKKP
jgi:riboflavin kinase/FMN adenylyltransferase